MKFKVYPRELFFALMAIILPVSIIFEYQFGTPYIGYADEILGIICLFYTFIYIFKNKLDQKDLAIVYLMFFLIVFTLFGNIFVRVITNWFPILVDMVGLFKIFTTYIVYKQIALADKGRHLLGYILPIGKVLIVLGAFFGLISQFVNIGMTSADRRYGIRQYNFLFGPSGGGSRYGYMIACILLLIFITVNLTKGQRIFYTVLSLFSMLLITKGVVNLVIVAYIILAFMWKNSSSTKLTPLQIGIIGIGLVGVSTYQIRSYILDENSPRMTLIRYGFKTANRFFPLGAGFASYGSEMSKRYYSPLYNEYGFYSKWGLSKESDFFLNDGYLSLLSGEFGYIGLAVFIAMMVLIFISIYKMQYANFRSRALCLAIFIGLVGSMLGTAIIKSSGGIFVMAMLGAAVGYCEQNPDDVIPPPSRRIKISF